MCRAVWMLCLLAACGDGAEAAGEGRVAAEPAAPVIDPGTGPVDLLASVPDDTPYLFALLEPLPAPVQSRLAGELVPVLRRLAVLSGHPAYVDGDAPVERLRLALLAELAGGDLLRPRGVFYDLRGVGVLRVETADAAALKGAIDRAVARLRPGAVARLGAAQWWTSDAADALAPPEAIYVAVDGRQLVVAQGRRELLDAVLPVLRREEPLPRPRLEADRPAALAREHGLSAAAIGFLDPARIGERLRVAPELLVGLGMTLPRQPACTEAIAGALGALPPVVIGARRLAADRIDLTAEMALSPALAAAVQAQGTVPGIPPEFPGKPLVGFALAGGRVDGGPGPWEVQLRQLFAACYPVQSLALAFTPINTVGGLALVIHGGKMQGFLPGEIDGYVVIPTRDARRLLAAAREHRMYDGPTPRDGGPFVRVPAGDVRGFGLDQLYTARRGDSLIVASGKGKAYAEDALAAPGPAPFLHVAVDLARFRAFGKDLERDQTQQERDAERAMEVDDGLLADAGLSETWARLIGSFDARIGAVPRGVALDVRLDLLPAAPAPAAPLPPPSPAIAECRRMLARSWQSATRAYPLLDVTDELDELERTYKTMFDALGYARACLQLSPAARACVLADADALAGARRCPDAAALEPPQLFSWHGPHPLEAETRSGRMEVSSEQRFRVPFSRMRHGDDPGWLVRDGNECWAISDQGLVVQAGCTFSDRDGGRWLDVDYAPPCAEPAGSCPVHAAYRLAGGLLREQ